LDCTTLSDRALIELCLAEGESAQGCFRELYGRYCGMVWRICAAVLPSPEDADDAAQEAFVKAFLSLSRFRHEASFGTWLARIAENAALNVRRSLRAHEPLLDPAAAPGDPASEAERRERALRVMQAIHMLPPAQRTLVTLREIEGLDYAAIARERGCSVGTVRSQLHVARRALRLNLRLLFEPPDIPPERSATMADCQWIRRRLEAFAEKELTRKARERAEDHLATCSQCTAALEGLKAGAAEVPPRERQWQGVWDSFTGLLTKKAFVDRLSEEVERARRYGRTLGLVFFDIDFFKKVNDTYGHGAGDRVIAEIARLVGSQSRAGDVACRYVDHFVVLLPETSDDGAQIVAERIRGSAGALDLRSEDGRAFSIKLSAGIAVYPHDGDAAEELMDRADQAMRQAKKEGGDRAVQLPAKPQEPAELTKAYLATVEALMDVVGARDAQSAGQARDVATLACRIAEQMGVPTSEIENIRAASLLKEVGKVGIPDAILSKASALDDAELQTMKQHPTIGADILKRAPFLEPVVPLVRHHHELFDGTGYPSGLAGDAIPLGARIIAVADAFVSLTSDLPYRRAVPRQDALSHLHGHAGRMYDPEVVAAADVAVGQKD